MGGGAKSSQVSRAFVHALDFAEVHQLGRVGVDQRAQRGAVGEALGKVGNRDAARRGDGARPPEQRQLAPPYHRGTVMRGGIGGFAGFRLETIRHRRLQPRVRQLLGEHRLGYGVLVKTSLLFPKRARQRVFEERPSKDARGDLRAPALAPRLRLAAYLVPAAQSRRALEVHAQLVQRGHGRGEVPVHDVLRVDVVQTARVEARDGRLQRQRDVPDFANPRVRRKGDARERGGVAARVSERVHQTAQTHAVAHVQREIGRSKVILANGFLFVEQFVPVVPEPAEHVALAVAARLQRGADHVAARLQSRAFSE